MARNFEFIKDINVKKQERKQKSGVYEKQEYTPFTSLFNIMYTH
jgi:hypothetical protein